MDVLDLNKDIIFYRHERGEQSVLRAATHGDTRQRLTAVGSSQGHGRLPQGRQPAVRTADAADTREQPAQVYRVPAGGDNGPVESR